MTEGQRLDIRSIELREVVLPLVRPFRTSFGVESNKRAMLVRGRDHYGHFELMQPAVGELDAAAIAAHERAVSLYRANYVEQEARHAEWADAS